jgi:hypothetical protein
MTPPTSSQHLQTVSIQTKKKLLLISSTTPPESHLRIKTFHLSEGATDREGRLPHTSAVVLPSRSGRGEMWVVVAGRCPAAAGRPTLIAAARELQRPEVFFRLGDCRGRWVAFAGKDYPTSYASQPIHYRHAAFGAIRTAARQTNL